MRAAKLDPEAIRNPPVTVIALCFNHARFLHKCLDSIAAQTRQDFQLIVADDCSTDDSAELIKSWIAEHRPAAMFIRHTQNSGLCKTLNEALSHARGDFISMIATDDVWEREKIACQLDYAHQQATTVAVIYSDASRMDESGLRMEPNFIEAHTPECKRPSGRIFSILANRNFIPAMSTLIRRQSLIAVGGYDERLSYEDYDMWLRLAARFEFAYYPAVLARYRIVSTSLVRTIFIKPSALHLHTTYLICQKWLSSDLLSPSQRQAWSARQWESAYGLYVLGDSRAKVSLWQAAIRTRTMRAFVLATACSLGVSRSVAKRVMRSPE